MLYDAYEVHRSWLAGASTLANIGAGWMQNPVNPFAYSHMGPIVASALDVFAHASAPRGKPDFGLDTTIVEGRSVRVVEEVVLRKPFGQLKHFRRHGVKGGPKLLIVAPMSGHYATLLRGTVERMLPGHDVYITDWRDAKLVSLDEGSFDLDDYVDYLVAFLEKIGPGAHMLAVCQPSVPAYAAAALMSADRNPCRPRTLTMMGGPIDTRKAPTEVNIVATQRPYGWFESNVIATVPYLYPGRLPAPLAPERRAHPSRTPGRSGRDQRCGPARDRGRARRHIGRRPDQGGAGYLEVASGAPQAISPRQGRRPLRHLQRQQVAQPDRSGRRGVDRQARRLSGSRRHNCDRFGRLAKSG